MTDNKQLIDNNELLSATRGNRFGFAFFRLLLKCCGLRAAGCFVWLVTLFYALFDRTACRRARPLLECLHPDASALRRFWHTWRLFTNQGRAILLTNYLAATGREIPTAIEKDPLAIPLTDSAGQAVIIVSSHFGAWQAAFVNRQLIHRPITFMDKPDEKAALNKFQAMRAEAGQVAEIAPDRSAAGGLLEVMNALARNEMVGMMGDRADASGGIAVPFGNGEVTLLASPWLLAARMHAPVVVFLVGLQWHPLRLVCRFSKPIHPADIAGRRLKAADLRPALALYAEELRDFCRRFPDQWFKFQ